MAAAKFNLKCKIFMGAKDVERQSINVFSMRSYGAEVVPVNSVHKLSGCHIRMHEMVDK